MTPEAKNSIIKDDTCIPAFGRKGKTMAKERRDSKNRILNKGEYQKKDGRYVYRYKDVGGEARFVYSWTLTQTDRPPKGRDAPICLRELEKNIAKDIHDEIDTFQAKRLTLNHFWDEYINQKQELKNSTRSDYICMYQRYVYKTLGKKLMYDIKYSDIKNYYNRLIREKNLGIGSVALIHAMLHPIFTIAVRDGYIRTNPSDRVLLEVKKTNNCAQKKRHALTEQEQEVFVEYVKHHSRYSYWAPIIAVLLGTGCRIGEVVGLRWEDCDFKNDIIKIDHNILYKPNEKTQKYELHVSTPKTEAGIREVPMLSGVKRVLLQEKIKQMKNGCNKSIVDNYRNFIFSNHRGNVVVPSNMSRMIKQIIKSYNASETQLALDSGREPILLPDFSTHNLRHTFCTRMCENESNIKIIQEIMGHATITTTMDIYNEATMDKKKQSFAALDGKFKIS